MSPLTKNYQYYESGIDKLIGLDFTKGREYNVDVVNNWYKQLPTNSKLKTEWGKIITMVMCFEISYERYLKDSPPMFKEADENDEVLIPREQTPIRIIEIEDEMNKTSSERKDESNTVDINDKLQLNKIEKEKIILISDDDRYTYKEKYKINFNKNIFTLLRDLYIELQRQSNPEN
jgi:hypothetical protein